MNNKSFRFACLAILLVGFCYIPPYIESLGYFDWPKRIAWSILAVVLLCAAPWGRRLRAPDGALNAIRWIIFSLACWMLLRSYLRPNPWVELETLAIWLLPLLTFQAGLKLGPPKRALVACVVLAALAQTIIMVLQYKGYDPFFAATTDDISTPSWRMIGTIGYQNQAAAFIALGIGFSALWLRDVRISLPLLAWSLLVTSLTGCRGATAATVAAAGLGWIVRMRSAGRPVPVRRAALFFLLLALGGGLFAVAHPVMRSRLLELTKPDDPSGLRSRLKIARIAGRMWAERPVTGWGAGAFAEQYLARLSHELPDVKTQDVLQHLVLARQAHNEYLQFGAEFGLIGVGLACAAILLILRRIAAAPRPGGPAAIGYSDAGAIFVLAYMALHSLVNFPWQMAAAGPLAGLLLGVASSTPDAEATGKESSRVDAATPILFVVSLFVLYVSVECARLDHQAQACADSEARDLAGRWQKKYPWAHRQRAMLGTRLAACGESEQAIDVLVEASSGFKDITLMNNLAHALADSGRWSEAAEVYSAWAKTGLSHDVAMRNWVAALEHDGRPAEALQVMDHIALEWTPGDVRLQKTQYNEMYVQLQIEAGQTNEALARLRWLKSLSGEKELPPWFARKLSALESPAETVKPDAGH